VAGKGVSAAVILFITFLLYRKIDSIGKIGVCLDRGAAYTWMDHHCGIANGNFLEPLKNINTDFSWGIYCPLHLDSMRKNHL
jgi:hypothetical protein